MMKLIHVPLSPFGRLTRLVLAEKALSAEQVEAPLARAAAAAVADREGAAALAGGVAPTTQAYEVSLGPILLHDAGGAAATVLGGATAIAEYLEEVEPGRSLLPGGPAARAEIRRLAAWAGSDFWIQAVEPPLTERYLKSELRIGGPEVGRLRAARQAARRMLLEIAELVDARGWLGGESLSLADFALAAQISVLDYLGERPFEEGEDPARDWYALVKSRPAFRGVLADRTPRLPPAEGYLDLDF